MTILWMSKIIRVEGDYAFYSAGLLRRRRWCKLERVWLEGTECEVMAPAVREWAVPGEAWEQTGEAVAIENELHNSPVFLSPAILLPANSALRNIYRV